jgi:DNA-directed RNA polymerase subunit RPC12/RpoP
LSASILTCPNCAQGFRIPESVTGEVRCPSCLIPFANPKPPVGQAKHQASPNKTVLAEPEAMVRYTCPRCKKALESPASYVGQKLNCPGCGQRMQIPQPPAPPASSPPINKTVLALSDVPSTDTPANPPAPTPVPDPLPVVLELADDPPPAPSPPPLPRESCLECGVDVTGRSRVQSCPDCGSLFCSAQCYREHRYHSHDKKKKKRKRVDLPDDVECDYCGTTRRPYITSVTSDAGWITFIVLLLVFFPLCWVGLLMTETRVTCSDCGRRLN